jgi:plasmid stabilization system protein ParE
MPHIRFSQNAVDDLDRLREFLESKSPEAWDRAKSAIKTEIGSLSTRAGVHKRAPDRTEQHDMLVKFGSRGYTVRYHYAQGADVTILHIKHQREQDFGA